MGHSLYLPVVRLSDEITVFVICVVTVEAMMFALLIFDFSIILIDFASEEESCKYWILRAPLPPREPFLRCFSQLRLMNLDYSSLLLLLQEALKLTLTENFQMRNEIKMFITYECKASPSFKAH